MFDFVCTLALLIIKMIFCIEGLRKPGELEYGMRLSNDFVSVSKITSKHLYSEFRNKMNNEPVSQH